MYKNKKIVQIVACGAHGELGLNGSLIWEYKKDMKHFKDFTMGNSCVVGRKTWEKLPTLRGRTLSIACGQDISFALESATHRAELLSQDKIIIIGGGQIYKETFAITDEVYLTLFHEGSEADTFYENFGDLFNPEGDWNVEKFGISGRDWYEGRMLKVDFLKFTRKKA